MLTLTVQKILESRKFALQKAGFREDDVPVPERHLSGEFAFAVFRLALPVTRRPISPAGLCCIVLFCSFTNNMEWVRTQALAAEGVVRASHALISTQNEAM